MARKFLGGVAQFDDAAVVLQNAADNGKPEAGPLLSRCDVGFEQAIAVLLGKADAVVDDVDDDVAAVTSRDDVDTALVRSGLRHGSDRLGRILDDVGQRLRDQAAVEVRQHRILGKLQANVDIGVANTHQEHNLTHGVGDIIGRHHRFRHARELGKLVDHALDVVDLPDDGFGALLKHRRVVGDRAAVFAPQPFGGKLNWGKRILDLVCHAASDLLPRRSPLRRDQLG